MDKFSASSVGTSSRYAVLAANVSRVIAISEGRDLQPGEEKLFRRAGDLLDKIVQGSKFVEQKEAHVLSDPRENFLAFDHAMSALHQVDLESASEGGLTKIFGRLKDELDNIVNQKELETTDRVSVGRFFDALADLFYRDVANSSIGNHQTEFKSISHQMEDF
jgi:hypothetical protein